LPAARRHAAFMHSERIGLRQRHDVPFVERLGGEKKEGGKKGGAKEKNKGGWGSGSDTRSKLTACKKIKGKGFRVR
jgi:hypothetical protein